MVYENFNHDEYRVAEIDDSKENGESLEWDFCESSQREIISN